MKKPRSFVAAVILFVGLTGCSSGTPSGPRCQEDASRFPTCDGDVVVDCFGRIEKDPCADEQVCVNGGNDGRAWARCIPSGTQVCEPSDHRQTCASETAVTRCTEPLYGTGATRTESVECPTGQTCFDDGLDAECVTRGEQSCDPRTFEPTCDGQTGVVCVDGETVTFDACVDSICAIGPRGPVCVEPGAVPCEPGGFDEQCLDGHVRVCPLETGHTTTHKTCAADETCVVDDCFPADALPCDDASPRSTCGPEPGVLYRCDERYGLYREDPCDDSGFCVPAADRAYCVDAGSQPCDPANFPPRCDDATTRTICSPTTRHTNTSTCSGTSTCQNSPTGGWCVLPESMACDPRTDLATCTNGVFNGCDGASLFSYEEDCAANFVCVVDDLLGASIGGCLPASWPLCTEPQDQSCDGNTWQWCAGGRLFELDCGDEANCLTDGTRAECVAVDAAVCDAATFVPTCVSSDQLRECFEGQEYLTRCGDFGLVCSAGACVER